MGTGMWRENWMGKGTGGRGMGGTGVDGVKGERGRGGASGWMGVGKEGCMLCCEGACPYSFQPMLRRRCPLNSPAPAPLKVPGRA